MRDDELETLRKRYAHWHDIAALLAEIDVLRLILGDKLQDEGAAKRVYEQGLADGHKDGLRQLREVEADVQLLSDAMAPPGRLTLNRILGDIHGIIARDYPTAIYDREAKGTAPDEWDKTDSELARCGRCSQIRPCRRVPDPYLAEIHPEHRNEPAWWCRPCYRNRDDDI
jgi:hypothetical protein